MGSLLSTSGGSELFHEPPTRTHQVVNNYRAHSNTDTESQKNHHTL